MDELIQLQLIQNLENAEEIVKNRNINIQLRDPVEELPENEFKRLFRVSKDLFAFIVNMLRPFMKDKTKQTDLDILTKILIALRFFASGSYQLDIGSNWCLGVSQSSVSRSLKEVVDALNRREIFNEWVQFPGTIEELTAVRRRFYEKYDVPGIIGCIDCTHVAIYPPNIQDQLYPEHIYVNRKGYHSINVQLICDADLKILNVNARYPGSTHDAYIWNNSNVQEELQNLHRNGHRDYILLGDSGYPLRTYLFNLILPEPAVNTPEYTFNMFHKRIRSAIECCNGVLKMRFRCLFKHRVLHYKPIMACKIINACVVLHNLCIANNVDLDDEDDLEDVDFGIFDDMENNENLQNNIMRRVNPELAEGRQARQSFINKVFRQ